MVFYIYIIGQKYEQIFINIETDPKSIYSIIISKKKHLSNNECNIEFELGSLILLFMAISVPLPAYSMVVKYIWDVQVVEWIFAWDIRVAEWILAWDMQVMELILAWLPTYLIYISCQYPSPLPAYPIYIPYQYLFNHLIYSMPVSISTTYISHIYF